MSERKMYSLFDRLITLLMLCALSTGCAATIHTDQHAIGWFGQDVRLPCDFTYPDVIALYWTDSSETTKASLFKETPTSFDDRFILNDDFSLVIRDVQISDEGRYKCRLELDSGQSFINYTELSIYASPSIPHIEQCDKGSPENNVMNRHRICTVETSNTHPFHLECRVTGFRPNVTIKWISTGIVKQPIGEPFQRKLSDGTWEREVSISVKAKLDAEQNYTCTVTGKATKGTAWSTTATVLVPPMPTESMPHAVLVPSSLSSGAKVGVAIFVILLIICILVVAVLGCMVYLRRKGKLSTKGKEVLNHIPFLKTLYLPILDPEAVRLDELRKRLETLRETLATLRETLRDYTFKRPDGSKVQSAHIGLFGEMSAGKSSFMNSLEFAFSGEFKQSQVVGSAESEGGKTISRTVLQLSDNISLFDNRGMSDFQMDNLDEITAQLRGERGPDILPIQQCEQEEIHCGVFVFKISQFNRRAGMEFIGEFARTLRQYNGYPPMIVITHADSFSKYEKDVVLNELSTKHDINENIWFFENYTKEDSTEDEEKSIEMLKFLQAALKQCELTIVHVHRRKKVVPVKKKEKMHRPKVIKKKDEIPPTGNEASEAESHDVGKSTASSRPCVIS